jgi:RNA polymerase sigma-70 factor (sigma-E family)
LDDDFESFVESSFGRLFGFAFVLTGTRHDAHDLVQEALARVGVRWSRTAVDNPLAYTRRTMVRLNLNRMRRLRRELLHSDPTSITVPVIDTWDDGMASEWLPDALEALTPRQRTAVALRFVDDLDVASIAERMNCSVGTAKSHLSRGIQTLRDNAPSTLHREQS